MLTWLALSQARYYAWLKMKPAARVVFQRVMALAVGSAGDHGYRHEHPHEGYRPLTYHMLDANIVAVS